ncbi:bifunctional nitrate reductase/sulfite reductase flavoprotein subunit alpha [Niveibacterium sp. SC-1]|uniref:bifunctional nitrate reductase/sulfite reductase flavoprotein subunit alpha n=1 Tax=Niveibacterium sp. SC-1 TaxID=3135646 RepID=UPI00311DF626
MSTHSVRSVCPYCGVGCGIVMETDGRRVIKVSGDKQHPTNFGRLCTKGNTCAQALTGSGRLQAAYVRQSRGEEPTPLPMEAAIRETARRLRAILDAHGPDALSFYVSGQMSIEAQYLVNKLAKGFVGTNNIESNSRLCMASAGSGYKLSLGSDGPPGSYQDFDRADLFFVIGANMADCHPILFLRMMDRVKAGAKLIVVDPRRTGTADKASLYLQIKPGTDLALLNGLLHLLVANGHVDHAFIAEYTEGWEAMPAFLADYTPEAVAQVTGIPEVDIREAARMIGEAGEWMSCWTMGLNQSTHGTWNTNAICNLHLATGAICRPGSGPFSLTGQPNAMGGREMGYMGPGLPGQRSVLVAEDRAFMESLWGVAPGTLRTELGGGTIDMFEQMREGRIKACWIICTNPVASVPNRGKVIEALQAAELVITQDAFLDTETNPYADVLLPGALWAEAEGVMINSERNLTLMQKAAQAPGEAMADWQIVARVACEMGFAEAFSYTDASAVFDEIRGTWNPKTGHDLRGASLTRLRETPLQWPCPPEDMADRHPVRYLNDGVSQKLRVAEDGSQPRIVFATASGKAVFFARPHMDPAEMPGADFPFVLNTGRLQHQWHTMTKTGKIATLNKLNPGPFVEINPEDAQALGIRDKDRVTISSPRGKAVLPAVVTDRVRAGNCFAPFHWNDVFGEDLTINAVTSDAVDPISLQPECKFAAVALARVADARPIPDAPPDREDEAVLACADVGASTRPEQEFATMQIDAFARLLGLSAPPALALEAQEQLYLQGFIWGLGSEEGRRTGGVPTLPASAPLDPSKRVLVDGLLAGLFARTATSTTLPLATTTLPAQEFSSKQGALSILWASQTGNAEDFAAGCAERLREAGFTVSVAALDSLKPAELLERKRVLLLTSTFGDGDPPDNGAAFWGALQAEGAPDLTGLEFAVLAFGDSNYDQFCGFGRKLDARLETLGAKRLCARTDCEPDYRDTAHAWLDTVLARLKAPAPVSTMQTAPLAALALATRAADPAPTTAPASARYSRNTPFASRLILNRRLNSEGSRKDTRQFAFSLEGSGLDYEAGDALGVWPSNCPALVGDILAALKLSPAAVATVKDKAELSIADALLRHYEIARITPEVLRFVAERSGSEELQRLLAPEAHASLREWLWGRQIVDLLQAYPIQACASEWLSVLKRMQPRLYSIASSARRHPDEVHLTVSAVRYQCEGKVRGGVSSTFLADRCGNAEVPIFIQRSAHFRVPVDGDTPIIMVGPGTGIAPFRGFLQERQARGARGGNWLFFGEQSAATDFYYRDELEAAQTGGSLRLTTAFSRDQSEKIYVQHRMQEHGAELWRWLEEGAHFYVCGDASRMARDVDAALKALVQTHGGRTAEAADAYVADLGRQKRYLRDVY